VKKIQITTLGCKVNQYESASFHSGFETLGHHVVSSGGETDIIVINTCSVTGKAGAQSRNAIRKAIRQHPEAKIVITGCYSQIAAKELAEMAELRDKCVTIIGNGDKHLLIDAALQETTGLTLVHNPVERITEMNHLPIHNFGKRTRAYLRIQDGCNAFCTYCIVPFTRGRSRSLAVEEVLKQARIFEEEGYKEIVVTGIHVGYYGADLEEDIDIGAIMEKLCRATPAVRYRLSSIEPLEISNKLLDVMALNINFMPHLHIPLQSGTDDILLRMNRRYSTSRFAEILDVCRDKIKDIAIGIDILAGFPGETDTLFSQTYSFLKGLDFTYLHVFPYSRRPGTPAADFDNQVAKSIKDGRVAELRRLGDDKKTAYYSRFIGSTRSLLVESSRDSAGRLKGFTDNYIPVSFEGEDRLKNSTIRVLLKNGEQTTILGKVITEHER
jgi:threonylcarbamoyladenosine tRNA methylthiotransferase MtaB